MEYVSPVGRSGVIRGAKFIEPVQEIGVIGWLIVSTAFVAVQVNG